MLQLCYETSQTWRKHNLHPILLTDADKLTIDRVLYLLMCVLMQPISCHSGQSRHQEQYKNDKKRYNGKKSNSKLRFKKRVCMYV